MKLIRSTTRKFSILSKNGMTMNCDNFHKVTTTTTKTNHSKPSTRTIIPHINQKDLCHSRGKLFYSTTNSNASSSSSSSSSPQNFSDSFNNSTNVSKRFSGSSSSNNNKPKKIPRSFRAGPYKGALIRSDNDNQTNKEDNQSPKESDRLRINHEYSPSRLRQALRSSSAAAAASPSPPSISSSHSSVDSDLRGSILHFPHSETIKSHLEELLYPMKFSEQLACRIVSSKNLIKSQVTLDELRKTNDFGFAMIGEHNSKLSFMGRRMMHFALSSFLTQAPIPRSFQNSSSSSSSLSSEDEDEKREIGMGNKRLDTKVLEDALLTKFVLGQYVGNQWELEKIMRWRELEGKVKNDNMNDDENRGKGSIDNLRFGTGLWTARGHVVEAIIGAVMTNHGVRLSLAVFNSLVLPHLSFRLEKKFLPSIRAIQAHDRELEDPRAGLIDWAKIDIEEFVEGKKTDGNFNDGGHTSDDRNDDLNVYEDDGIKKSQKVFAAVG